MPERPRANILYENDAWNPPLVEALRSVGFSAVPHLLTSGSFNPAASPPAGIWINRLSPSAHTRGHGASVELGREFLFWLEAHGRRVVNGSRAFEIEMSKFRQDVVLRKHGIQTPWTLLVSGHRALLDAAASREGPVITKHNQGGKGLGITRFNSASELQEHLSRGGFDSGPGDKVILQQYIEPREPYITRVELVAGRFLFAMRSSTAEGFELCPADACQVPSNQTVCPADGGDSKFSLSPLTAQDPLVRGYVEMCRVEGLEAAGIEFVEDREGNRYTYDINGTTNYNRVFGEQIGVNGMSEFAKFAMAAWLESQP